MPLLKPARVIQLNICHPLARGLIGCWIFNQGSGNRVTDSSGNQNTGIITDAIWAAGEFGCCVKFDGSGDNVNVGNGKSLEATMGLTIVGWIRPDSTKTHTLLMKNAAYGLRLYTAALQTTLWDESTSNNFNVSFTYQIGKWYCIAATWDNQSQNVKTYVNGNLIGTPGTFTGPIRTSTQSLLIGKVSWSDTDTTNGLIDDIKIYNRVLSSAEIMHLYRTPFCMFERAISPAFLIVPTIDLAGTSTSHSTALATVKRIRRIKGYSAAITDITAILTIIGEVLLTGSIIASSVPSSKLTLSYRVPWLKSPLKTERQWLTDALFTGMTSNAFKLGTTLSCGWFWMRPSGCAVLYRGPGMEQIDFINILAVIEQNAESMPLPSYIPHNSDSIYFYVVRRFNSCGYHEYTLQASVKVVIDADGSLAQPQPNSIFAWQAEQVDSDKVRLVWFYCPLEQKSQPMRFKVYYDGGTGQINYENPIDEIVYRGREFYSYRSDALAAGRYLFAIRSEDVSGMQNKSSVQLAIEIVSDEPNVVEILKVETI